MSAMPAPAPETPRRHEGTERKHVISVPRYLGGRWLKTLAALTTVLLIGVAIHAQQDRAAANVTNAVLQRAGAANDAMPGAWLSYGRTQS